mgnify:FL=1
MARTAKIATVRKVSVKGRVRGRTEDGAPNPIDRHVGNRVRQRRTLLGMSQEKLGEEIGLTFQQVQKYERGANRISASRLFDLARVLDVPVSFFFDDMDPEVAAASPAAITAGGSAPKMPDIDPMTKRETLELVRAYYRIPDATLRKRLLELAKAAASPTEEVAA